ncbi:hypothetical protein [Seonamhaeicola marinus]|uniref:Cbb3-type cytochrome c oxidase subunit I n=1 Tax=Seonamhaeicola marinus TaxID=1912246 RepID=A0A5D0HKX0_9FLAO|nr:hypothetical protein [Seonamhaeicola marinus]TYA71620.1 hypothetical protein FUA24_18790 [Seonamhaeicola marinus]
MIFNVLKQQSLLALFYFFIIAFLGVVLRAFPVFDINIDYRYIVHTHSHIALLGWVYTALMVLLYKIFLKDTNVKKTYSIVFWFTQITIVGMLCTFPFTGYALFSILFSSLFLIASYIFARLIFKHTPKHLKTSHGYKCVRIALWYMIISSIGPWALGYIMTTFGNTSSWYRNAIYFYLHFQYNGWFILALFGILFYILEQNYVKIPQQTFSWFYRLFNTGVVLTFGISILWMAIDYSVNLLSGLGAIMQILAFYLLIKTIFKKKTVLLSNFSKCFLFILKVLFVCFTLKLVMQLVGVIPSISKLISYNLDFIIGYIHWIFLGVVSLALLGFLYYFKLVKLSKGSVVFYVIGFVATEIFIFYKGLAVWSGLYLPENNLMFIFIVSFFFFAAILLIFVQQSHFLSVRKRNS